MRLLYLGWPQLAIRLELGRVPDPLEPVILGTDGGDPALVLDRSVAAARLGVRRGRSLEAARTLAPDALVRIARPAAYVAAMTDAIGRLETLVPAVEGSTDPFDPAFGRLFLGIEGLGRLWGTDLAIARRAVELAAPAVPGPPLAGVAGTRFAARTAATGVLGTVSGARIAVVPAGDAAAEAALLAPLPIGLLPADAAVRDRFRILGLRRIGDLAVLDRSAVIARFGPAGGELHDLARGLDGRPLRPRRPVERLHASVELDPPAETLEPIRFVLRRLCGSLCEQLGARGAGVGRASVELVLDPAGIVRHEQPLPEPSAAADLLERLLAARLEAAPPPAPVARLTLELHGAAPAAGEQLGLFSPEPARAGRLEWQLAALAIRHGPGRLLRARLRDPEASLALDRFGWAAAGAGEGAG